MKAMMIVQTVLMMLILAGILISGAKVDGAIARMSVEIQKISDRQSEIDRRVTRIEDKIKP